MIDHKRLIAHVADYITEQIDDSSIGGLAYSGLLPPINSRSDYENFPPGLFPFVGVAAPSIDYVNDAIGLARPNLSIQVIFASRGSGTAPDELVEEMLEFTQQIQTILFSTARSDRFDLPDIEAMEVNQCFTFPTFYTNVDGNRKAFSIAFFTVTLYLGGI